MCRRVFAVLVLILAAVLSPLRVSAATVPVLFAYDVAVRLAATTWLDAGTRIGVPGCVYDDALHAYESVTRPRATGAAAAVHAYDNDVNLDDRRELAEGVIYDASAVTTAAEGVAGPEASIIGRSFRAANPARPPNTPTTQRMSEMQTCWSTECSEIAERLLDSAGTGRILRAEPSTPGTSRVLEDGAVQEKYSTMRRSRTARTCSTRA